LAAPDIFLSYNREDAARAKQFADGFTAEGLDVWWDVALRSGEAYDKVTEEALRNARAVVVLWSPRSVESRWVRAEATLADRRNTLMPAMIEPCERPIMFELVQTAELSHWHGDTSDPIWRAFASHVRDFIGKAPVAPTPLQRQEPLPTLDQLRVAVLPFLNMGGDPEQEYFADGITEDVITDLSKVSALKVIARNTAFTFKGKSVDVADVARRLNVTHVLEGSIRKAGNKVRVTAQLIDGGDASHVWAERYDRNLDDIFELQDELSQAIVKALKVKLLPDEKTAIQERGTNNTVAYDLYMRGRAAANAARTYKDFAKAADLYRGALAVDPSCSKALSGIAMMSMQAVIYGANREMVGRDLDRLYEDAVARSAEDVAIEVLKGVRCSFRKQWSQAYEAFEKAMAATPSIDADLATIYANQVGAVGRNNDGIRLLEEARKVDPLSAFLSVNLQFNYMIARRFGDSRAEYLRIFNVAGNREDNEHNELFRVWMEGDSEAIRLQYRRFLDSQAIGLPAWKECFEVLDQPEAARAILRKAHEDPANMHGTIQMLIACHAGLHGDPQLAVAAMRRSFIDCGTFAMQLCWYPFLKEARQTPEFKQLARDLGIHDYWRATGNWGDFARPVGEDDFQIIG
jgi:TolB-like protein